MIALLIAVAVVGFWIARRRRRAARLSGLTATAPVFSVEPPHRRMSGLKGERL